MEELLQKAGLTPDVLKDPVRLAAAVNEYNAQAGGLRALMRAGKLTPAGVNDIPDTLPLSHVPAFLRFVTEGKRIPILFAAGRATRMRLPRAFDCLGIGGLTPRILTLLDGLREGEEAPLPKIEADGELSRLVRSAANGEIRGPEDLSFIQRQLLQWRYQLEKILLRCPEAGVTVGDWEKRAFFSVVANDENKSALALQLAALSFAGLRPEHVRIVVQPEEGGYEVLSDGATRPYSKNVWPEGHGKPFLDMNNEPRAVFSLNARGHLVPLHRTFVADLERSGVERAVFAQVNDLHLLEDMVHAERWLAADALMKDGAEMVMEMVSNGLKQKGGGIFTAPGGHVVMRDSIAMQAKDLEPYSVPPVLSRMFYELSVSGMSKLAPGTLPAYLTERRTSGGKTVLTREFYSGDASSKLRARAVRRPGYALDTFKMQARIPQALEALKKQDSQPGFKSVVTY